MSYASLPAEQFNTGQVAIGVSASSLILPFNRQRAVVTLSLVSSNNIYLGNSSGVTVSTGFPLTSSNSPIQLHCRAAIYGIAAKSSTLSYVEETW